MSDLDGTPRLQLGTSDQFFDHVEAELSAGAVAPVWRGELYFEMHRGTLTSQIETKVGNRRCERLLREAELWWAAGGAVPTDVAEELRMLWNDVLLQQFHDIIPGSSIAWVHDDAEREHARVSARLEELITAAFDRMGVAGVDGDDWVVANAASQQRTEVVSAPDGSPLIVQVPGSCFIPLDQQTIGFEDVARVVTTERSMANGQLAVSWDLDGAIASIIDVVRGRELLPPRRSITVELAPDHPVEYDAWDLESWTTGLGVPVTGDSQISWLEQSPLRARLQVRRRVGVASTMTIVYTLRAASARLDLEFDIDWHESEQLLSLMVPLDVRASEAVCDIQFGHVRRPTHPSSPWDAAKFEVCAHRFVDVAEPEFGVAVLNDGRYGHGLFDGGVRVSLLRAPRFPDPDADQGRHRVTISILPHGAGLHEVLHEAELLNLPVRFVRGTLDKWPGPVVQIDEPGVQLSAVKRADDGNGDLIVRLYEACGDRRQVSVRLATPMRAAVRCNALEEPLEAIDVADGFVSITLRPFELVTLRLS